MLINTLTCKQCQSMRMTGEAIPSETEAAKSELSVSVITVEENKEDEKTVALSRALA